MEQKVTSVSKTEQAFSDTAAAVFVITQDDLRPFRVTNIPEAPRMVPGVQVARIDSNKWAITARGFNGRFANKLLVLIDGRTVYAPMHLPFPASTGRLSNVGWVRATARNPPNRQACLFTTFGTKMGRHPCRR